jgi:hypothetical protein
MPQWYPAMPRTPFRDRVVKLWAAVAGAFACLAVGLGAGFAIGHAADDDGPARFGCPPGGACLEPGLRYHFGSRP